jgi:hypothetical protein
MAAQDYEQVTYNGPTGAQVGQSATEKVGFFGATPVVQGAAVVDATDAATAITSLNLVITRLETLGLIAAN